MFDAQIDLWMDYEERLSIMLESGVADAERLAAQCVAAPAVQLRPYQQQAVLALLDAVRAGEHPVCDLPTGSGKSLIIAELCRQLPGRILVATHRKELLSQNNAQLTKLLGSEEDAGIYSAGLQARTTEARVIFGGVQSIYTKMEALQAAGPFGTIIVDECFPAGTFVDGKPIEDWHAGEYVNSFNHNMCRIEPQEILATSVRQVTFLLKITLKSGTIIRCTPSHPFWTGEAYEEARALVVGDCVFLVPIPSSGRRYYVNNAQSVAPHRSHVLLPGTRTPFEKCASFNNTHCQQPDAQPCNSRQGHGNITAHRASTTATRGEWAGDDTSATHLSTASQHGMARRICGDNARATRGKIQKLYSLPYRPGSSFAQNCYRDRRGQPSSKEGSRARQEERSTIGGLRMDRVALLECEDYGPYGGVLVYNLHIAENHNYFANTILVHNCHLVPPRSVHGGMYHQVFAACPDASRIGLSATPYRLDGGPIYGAPDSWFTRCPVQVTISELTAQGYLAPLIGVRAARDIDLSAVRIRQGEYVQSDLAQVMAEEQRVKEAVTELVVLAAQRQTWLVFCVDLTHTAMVTQALQDAGIDARMVTGSTPAAERDALIDGLRRQEYRCLVNCQVATTGFDIPDIDCIVLLRPTQSKSLLVQMIGRGTRLKRTASDCVVLDYADTLRRHLPLDAIPTMTATVRVTKEEASQREAEAATQEQARAAKHRGTALDEEALDAHTPQRWAVHAIGYRVTPSKRQPGTFLLQVGYHCPARPQPWVSTWLCVEYTGWPRMQAEAWFTRRQARCPATAEDAHAVARTLEKPRSILVESQGKFPRVLVEYFDEKDAAQ